MRYSPLALAKLASSGLTADDAKILGIKNLTATETQKLSSAFMPLESLHFEYYAPSGELLANPKEKFARIRYLEQPEKSGFKKGSKDKPKTYMQTPGSGVYAYYPKNQDWSILQDPSIPLIITEGELKAAKACKEKFPTIGLSGVWSWKSAQAGQSWIPSLEFIDFFNRHVYICFDADYSDNPSVAAALIDLADELTRRGAHPHLTITPNMPEFPKTGIDDFLTHGGDDAAERFAAVLKTSPHVGLSKELIGYNKRYIYARNPGIVVSLASQQKVTPNAFKDHLESKEIALELYLDAQGSLKSKKSSAAATWLRWPLRNECERLTYHPGGDILVEGDHGREYNLWSGWGCEPKKGDPKPFLELVDHLFTGADPKDKEWFIQWAAYPLIHPGTKLATSVIIHGVKQGTGKSLVGYTLARIYGKNFSEIDHDDMTGQFNEWADGKQFIMGDDVSGGNKRADADRLKKMITQKELRINAKHLPTYTMPDRVNYYFTANHSDSFYLEDSDRRFFVHQVAVGPMGDAFYDRYGRWLEDGGAEAVFYYLQHVDVSSFNPNAAARRTVAKDVMTDVIQSDHGAWVRDLRDTPDAILMLGKVPLKRDLYTAQELHAMYIADGKITKVTPGTIGRELSNAAVPRSNGGKKIFTNIGGVRRTQVYYIVRNAEKWLKASVKDITAHVESDGKKTVK